MTAVGVLLIGFGALAVWAGFARVSPFDVLRAVLGAQLPTRTSTGAVSNAQTTSLNAPAPGSLA